MSLATSSSTHSPYALSSVHGRMHRSASAVSVSETKSASAASSSSQASSASASSSSFTDMLGNAYDTTVSFSEAALKSLESAGSTAVDSVVHVAEDIGSGIKSGYLSVKHGFAEAMATPLGKEIAAAPGAIASTVSDAAESAVEAVPGLASDALSVVTLGAVGSAKLLTALL